MQNLVRILDSGEEATGPDCLAYCKPIGRRPGSAELFGSQPGKGLKESVLPSRFHHTAERIACSSPVTKNWDGAILA
jgi:hypothetical protein